MTNDEEIRRAKDAARITGDPAFISAFSAIESSLIAKMRQVAMADRDTQHELILSLQLLGSLKSQFEQVLQTGRMAEIQKETLAQKVKKFVR